MTKISRAHTWIKTNGNAWTPMRFWSFTVYTDSDKADLSKKQRDDLHPITAWYVPELLKVQGFELES